MTELARLKIARFRSIEEVEIFLPPQMPVVLFGQNNAGKSNIIRALEIILGEQYPKSVTLEQSDYFRRDHTKSVEIVAEFRTPLGGTYNSLQWSHERDRDPEPTQFLGIRPWGPPRFPRNEEREHCIAVVIEANRNLNYQLSYASKYTMLSRLMHRFHEILHQYDDLKLQLEQNFKTTKEIFERVPEFMQFSQALRDDFSTALECWSYKLNIDFEAYNPLNFFHALRVQAKEENETRAFEELGTGEQQVLAISFAHAYAKAFRSGFILVIEEPEAHLHPLAQGWLAERIRKMCEDGLQIVLSTHSPSFLDMLSLPGMHLVYKENSVTRVNRHNESTLAAYCVQRGADRSRCAEQTILPFYAANTNEEILKGFFARAVVLVEGPTEALALPIYLAAFGCNPKEKGIAVIPVHGKGSMARYIRLFEAYGIPTYSIFDNDPHDDGDGNKRKEIIETYGYEFDESLLAIGQELYVNDYFAVFGVDFESVLRDQLQALRYTEKEDTVKELYGPAKPLIAREVAALLADEVTNDDCWEPIKTLAGKICSLVE